jgi:hypothetical protein
VDCGLVCAQLGCIAASGGEKDLTDRRPGRGACAELGIGQPRARAHASTVPMELTYSGVVYWPCRTTWLEAQTMTFRLTSNGRPSTLVPTAWQDGLFARPRPSYKDVS